MKTIILNEDTIIDGRQRVKGEVIQVDDSFPDSRVKEVINELKPDEQPKQRIVQTPTKAGNIS